MNAKLFPSLPRIGYNRANAHQRHRLSIGLYTRALPYIPRRRRRMRPFRRSSRRSRIPSECGRGRFCRCGCGFYSRWIPNCSSRAPALPFRHRCCSRSGCRYRRRSSPFPCRWGLWPRDAPDRGCPDRLAAPDRWCNRRSCDCRPRRPSSRAQCRWAFCHCRGSANGRHTISACGGSNSRSPRAGRLRAPSSRPRCRWDPWPREAPGRGCTGSYRRFQRYPTHDGRTRNRTCNIQPRIRRWLRTSDTLRRPAPRMNEALCFGFRCTECRSASARRRRSPRYRQACGLPCIFPSNRRTNLFPRRARRSRSNLPFLCGWNLNNRYRYGCRCHWSLGTSPSRACSGLFPHVYPGKARTWRALCNPLPKSHRSLPSRCGWSRACRRGCGFYFRWTSIRPSHAPAWNTRRTWCRGNSRHRALR